MYKTGYTFILPSLFSCYSVIYLIASRHSFSPLAHFFMSSHRARNLSGLSGHGSSGHGLSWHGLSGHGSLGHGISWHDTSWHSLSRHSLSGHGPSGHGSSLQGRSGHGPIIPFSKSYPSQVHAASLLSLQLWAFIELRGLIPPLGEGARKVRLLFLGLVAVLTLGLLLSFPFCAFARCVVCPTVEQLVLLS